MTEHEANGSATSGKGLPNDPNNVPENGNGCGRIKNTTPPAPVAASAVDVLRQAATDVVNTHGSGGHVAAIYRLKAALAATPSSPNPVADNPAGETIVNVPRPMTGFFAHLTPEQKRKALAYRGPENHGSDEFRVLACLEPGQGPISPEEIAGWEATRGQEMQSALGEYVPEEFWRLLDAYKAVAFGAVEPVAAGWQATHRHVKRGTTYKLLGKAECCVSDGDLGDAELVYVYQRRGGDLYVRRVSEFEDGRFEPLPAAPGEGNTGTRRDLWSAAARSMLAAYDAAVGAVRGADAATKADGLYLITAAATGVEAYEVGPPDRDHATVAMLRAMLTAIIDPDDPSLDYLRASAAPGEG